MAHTITIDKYTTLADESKMLIGLRVTDDTGSGGIFIVDKKIDIASDGTKATYTAAAYEAAKNEINAWLSDIEPLGQTFNPDDGSVK